MYKQYRFQYTTANGGANNTTDNNNTDAANNTNNNTTDNNNTKTPVEVTADDVINAVKDWVALENIRKKEYDQLRDNGNWTNLNNNEEDHDKTRSIKKTQNFQQTTDLTRTTNWTTVENKFTNKNTPVPNNMCEAYDKAIQSAHYMLNQYFLIASQAEKHVNNIINCLDKYSDEQKINIATEIRDFLSSKKIILENTIPLISDTGKKEELQSSKTSIIEAKRILNIFIIEKNQILKRR